MKKKTNLKRLGAIIAAMIMTSCSCFTITASAENESRIISGDQKTFIYVETPTRSSDLVYQDIYSINRQQYSCDAYFNLCCSGTMTLTLKKQNSYGLFSFYDSCSVNFSNAWYATKSKSIGLPPGKYRIYVDITTNQGNYNSHSIDFDI